MREYLFRGKRTDNGEWVEGYYFCVTDNYTPKNRCYITTLKKLDNGEIILTGQFEVIPESVGQYIGLTDKNGKKIFEGDIVRTQPFSDRPYSKKAKFKQHIGVVEYYIRRHNLREQDYEAGWQVKIKDYGGYGCCDWSAFFQCEVIGNVFENVDLLEG